MTTATKKMLVIRTEIAGIEMEYTEHQAKNIARLLARYAATHEFTTDKGEFYSCKDCRPLVSELNAIGVECELRDE